MLNDNKYFHDKYRKTGFASYELIYKHKRKEAKYELRACEKNYTNSIEESIESNTKAFFAHTKSLNKSNRLPNVMKLNDQSSDNPTEIVNLFSKHFESVYEPGSITEMPNYNCNCGCHQTINETQIKI